LCGKDKEENELKSFDFGNGVAIKLCNLCFKAQRDGKKGGKDWKEKFYPKRN